VRGATRQIMPIASAIVLMVLAVNIAPQVPLPA
jgi:hypothetical protein